MDDEKEIVYIALSNSIIHYNNLLEDVENLSQEEIKTAEYLLSRSIEVLDKYSKDIVDETQPMKKPVWK